ncbi:MAG: NAD+ synthase [Gammaproteobacteria bacterium]|nr:NAD+ synthase [Gammaproteobacteria bacterium]
MTDVLRIALAQQDFLVGDVAGNTARIAEILGEVARTGSADLVMFPELAMCGYPPEDLLFHAGLRRRVADGLVQLAVASRGVAALVGYPEFVDGRIHNSVALFAGGRQLANYRKCCLPNYSVFDEERYFAPGDGPTVVDFGGMKLGLGICEDVWQAGPSAGATAAGAEVILAVNGSPFEVGKQALRERVLADRARETGRPLVYLNMVGGQDELVFDGGSCVVDAGGATVFRAPSLEACVPVVTLRRSGGRVVPEASPVGPLPDEVGSVYEALVTGVRDYVRKNGFPGVVLGLSGGIDSALTLAIAVDAIGAQAVQAVMMPYRYTAAMSIEDAAAEARDLGVDYQVLPIESLVEAARGTLAGLFAGLPEDTTEENLQSRARGILLMAISNKTGRMVLATGNKSEMAVGYATLYGDMAGGFAPIKDCTKTLVYQLARYRNSRSPVIPERVITRPPSAELRPGQQDSDSLPPYDVLDPILDALILENRSVDDLVGRGVDRAVATRVLEMVRKAEYKRRQAPPGVRISSRAFGRDWRYPITSGYRHR